jgi:hypothetical protein
MSGEYTAAIVNFEPTLLCDHPRLGRVRMNAAAYNARTCGPIIEPPTTPPRALGVSDPANKDPRLDAEGRRIADLLSPLLRA